MRLLQLLERRLDELQEIGDPSGMTAVQLMDELETNGWRPIGNDSRYSEVYGKDSSPWVVKILRRGISNLERSESNENFQCAMKWYRFCLNNWENNPHLPRIPFVKTLLEDDKDRQTRTYVVMIERLEPFDNDSFEWRREDPIEHASMWTGLLQLAIGGGDLLFDVEALVKILKIIPKKEMASIYRAVVDDYEYDMESLGTEPERGTDEWLAWLAGAAGRASGEALGMMMIDAEHITGKHPHTFVAALNIAHKMVNSSDCTLDLHSDNVMVRPSTGELVITDPVQG